MWDKLLDSLAGEDNYFFLETNLSSEADSRNYLFLNPIEEINVRASGEAEAGFARIEEAVEDGLYAAGLFSYELGYSLDEAFEPPPAGRLPLMSVGLYRDPGVYDVRRGAWNREALRIAAAANGSLGHGAFSVSEPAISETYPVYERNIGEIKRLIERGDTYQINYTVRLDFFLRGDPLALYIDLRGRQKVAYSGMWRRGDMSVLSFSPELFFRIEGGEIEVRPMKGTAPRGAADAEDAEITRFLESDTKNRAENIMIVDLLRNDLGRVSQKGSVSVPRLFEVEKYETLFQMTSTVKAKLAPDAGIRRIFSSLFPSGSVTGAPKISSMRIIRSLEKRPRGIYTGAIGFIAPQRRKAVFNVSIRTVSVAGGRAEMGIGGGIVYDSTPESEWREALLKAGFLLSGLSDMSPMDFSLIETFLWLPVLCRSLKQTESREFGGDDRNLFFNSESCPRNSEDGGLFLEKLHFERLAGSAKHFGFKYDESAAKEAIAAAVADPQHAARPLRVRLLLGRDGGISVTVGDPGALPPDAIPRFTLSDKTVLSSNPFLRHKTTVRNFYDEERAASKKHGFFDVVFMNERGELTEGAITNLFVRIGGALYTPPAECGLLEGVFRRHLLETGEARERVLYPRDLAAADEVFLCNSVRGMLRAEYVMPD